MCGITACVGVDVPVSRLLDGLRNLEYRGYDSAGVAVRTDDGLETALAVAARNRSYPGVVVAADPAGRVDFEASLAATEEADCYVVEAVTKRAETRTLAGIPAYNEAETIAGVVSAASTHVDEVLVVDDGTVERARAAGATVRTHDRNWGYGRAL